MRVKLLLYKKRARVIYRRLDPQLCPCQDAERLSREDGVDDAGDGGGQDGLKRTQLVIRELAEEGAEGDCGSEAREEEKECGRHNATAVVRVKGVSPVPQVIRCATLDVSHEPSAKLAGPTKRPEGTVIETSSKLMVFVK